jgi:hypothetical protein
LQTTTPPGADKPSTAISSGLLPASRPTREPPWRTISLDHPPLLVDLDRIDGGVAAPIIQLGDGGGEGVAQGIDPVVEDVAEAGQHRQPVASGSQILGQGGQIDPGMAGPARRANPRPARLVDVEVAAAPAGGIV